MNDGSFKVARAVGSGVESAAVGMSPLAALQTLAQVVDTVAQMHRIAQEERTRRTHIEAQLLAQIESIRAVRDVITDYLARSFEERRVVFDDLFTRLDEAMTGQDISGVATVLGAIVDVAKHSPLAEAAELVRVASALKQEGTEWTI
jgi:hypothetical protein